MTTYGGMFAPDAYFDSLEGRLVSDGCVTQRQDWSGTCVLVGRRSDVRMRWVATRLDLFTIAAVVPEITAAGLSAFTEESLRYAKAAKGGRPLGMQAGIGAFPVLISDKVDPAAAEWARARQRVAFACMARPVVVDLSCRSVSTYRGKPGLGRLYASYFIQKSTQYFDLAASGSPH
ncbi:levansucrase [Streptomyces sp. NPDC057694]|uniref:levansucrase n=1 Tax=Streptomyces sp. NPDC057694 TaxID=3346216 RepID=UPI0036CEAF28